MEDMDRIDFDFEEWKKKFDRDIEEIRTLREETANVYKDHIIEMVSRLKRKDIRLIRNIRDTLIRNEYGIPEPGITGESI